MDEIPNEVSENPEASTCDDATDAQNEGAFGFATTSGNSASSNLIRQFQNFINCLSHENGY